MRNNMKRIWAMVLAVMMIFSMASGAMAAEYYSGSLSVGGRVKITPAPTKAPTPAPEATDEPVESIEPTEEVEPTESIEPVESIEPTESPEPTESIEPTESPEAPVEETPLPETEATPEPAYEARQVVIAKSGENDTAFLREGPSTDYERVGKVRNGTIVTVLGEENGWAFIEVDGMQAWISGSFLSFDLSETVEPEETATPELTAEPTATPEASAEPTDGLEEAEEVPAVIYEYELNEDGTLKLDESGNPVAIIPEGAEKPVSFLRDENGALVFDENGKPIVLATIPVNAGYVGSIEDELDPNRHIDIYADWGGDELHYGDAATMIAVLYGYENAEYTVQWQTSPDSVNWTDVPGATDTRYELVVTEENHLDYWRLVVTITDITE